MQVSSYTVSSTGIGRFVVLPAGTFYSLYWLSFFASTIFWALACIFVRSRNKGQYPRKTLARMTTIASGYGLLFLIMLPLVTGLAWYWLLLLIAAGILVKKVPYWLFSGEKEGNEGTTEDDVVPGYYQLRNSLSQFYWTMVFALVGLVTGHTIWLMGASVLLATAIWNVYSEYALRPAILEFYSDVDDRTLWSGPLLPEELPNSLTMLAVLFVFPFENYGLGSTTLRRVFQLGLPPLVFFFFAMIVVGYLASFTINDEQKRVAVSRLLYGTALLVGLMIVIITILSHFVTEQTTAITDTRVSLGNKLPDNMTHNNGVLLDLLWMCVFTLSVGTLVAVVTAAKVLIKRHEYDVFVSYSFKDRIYAEHFVTLLREYNLREFFAHESLCPGDPFPHRIIKAIRNSFELAILYSKNSCESKWVFREGDFGLGFNKRIVPVLVGVSPEDIPDEYIRVNFSAIDFEGIEDYIRKLKRRARR